MQLERIKLQFFIHALLYMGTLLNKTTIKKQGPRELVEAFIIAILIALFIRTFLVQAFKIPSGSMLPTLYIGDYLLVNKFIYGVRMPFTGKVLVPVKNPKRDDIIVFRFPKDRSIDYIKRVVGLPGDSIELREKTLYINGEKVEDSHAYHSSPVLLRPEANPRDSFAPITVPAGHYFVMGDNRDNSNDSRYWGFVSEDDILGKAMVLYWSWDIEKNLLSADRFSSVRFSRIGSIIK